MDYRDRLQRPRAINATGHAHELTFSCYRKYPFLTERTCVWLADAIEKARKELGYALWAYVFMPDHVHLVVFPRDHKYEDSDFLKCVKEKVSRDAVAFLKEKSPEWLAKIRVRKGTKVTHRFWQAGRGHDRNIIQPKTLLSMIDYVHANPVRRGLVTQARDWKWSSAGWFEGQPLNNLKPDPIPLGLAGRDDLSRRDLVSRAGKHVTGAGGAYEERRSAWPGLGAPPDRVVREDPDKRCQSNTFGRRSWKAESPGEVDV